MLGEVVMGGELVGQVDEVSLYDPMLSAEDVLGIYQAGSAGKCLD